jgi:ribosome biogenesis GTPase / thiamine phosphate phosphatase
MFLEGLGFTSELKLLFSELADPALVPARVARAAMNQAQVWTERGLTKVLVPRSIAERPVAGDWCAVDTTNGAVKRVLPRRQAFVRQAAGRRTEAQVIATNVDVAFLLMGLDTDFNLRRLERYLTLVYESGATPVVLLTKAGNSADVDARAAEAARVAAGAPVRAIDVVLGIAADAPRAFLGHGTTVALLGSSGVGKSTLANFLLGTGEIETGAVRERDGRGQHTTARRELFPLPGGGALIDTPGMRELALWAEPETLDHSFSDIAALAEGCRFRDCEHRGEPACAVREAVEAGSLEPGRLASYIALRRELARHSVQKRERERRPEARALARAVRRRLREKGRLDD